MNSLRQRREGTRAPFNARIPGLARFETWGLSDPLRTLVQPNGESAIKPKTRATGQ